MNDEYGPAWRLDVGLLGSAEQIARREFTRALACGYAAALGRASSLLTLPGRSVPAILRGDTARGVLRASYPGKAMATGYTLTRRRSTSRSMYVHSREARNRPSISSKSLEWAGA